MVAKDLAIVKIRFLYHVCVMLLLLIGGLALFIKKMHV